MGFSAGRRITVAVSSRPCVPRRRDRYSAVMDTISIQGLSVPAVIGVHDWEREITQTLVVTVEMAADVRSAAQHDDLADALDYSAVARTIASVAAVCDLDLVVIGGGVARSGRTLFDPLNAALSDYAGLSFIRDLRVVPAALGGDAGLIGAAALVLSIT